LWDLTAVHETYFYDLSIILKKCQFYDQQKVDCDIPTVICFLFICGNSEVYRAEWRAVESGRTCRYTCSHTEVINRVDKYDGNRNAKITGNHTILNIQLELLYQLSYHTVYTSSTRWMKTHHMYFCVPCIVRFVTFTVLFVCICVPNNCHRVGTQLHCLTLPQSVIIPQRLNNFNCLHFNYYPFNLYLHYSHNFNRNYNFVME